MILFNSIVVLTVLLGEWSFCFSVYVVMFGFDMGVSRSPVLQFSSSLCSEQAIKCWSIKNYYNYIGKSIYIPKRLHKPGIRIVLHDFFSFSLNFDLSYIMGTPYNIFKHTHTHLDPVRLSGIKIFIPCEDRTHGTLHRIPIA